MREDSIERILQAARSLFANNGYAATTMQMIAKQAGLVPSGIYHYFAGKNDLLEAVLDRETAALDRSVLVGIQRHFIGKSAEEFLDYMAESVCENLDRISLMCHLVRFRCVSEYCSNKLHILQHIGGILQDYILDPEENRHAQELLIDFASSAVFYSVTHHQDVFYRQVEEIKEKASRLSFHSVVHSLDP